MSLFCQYCHDNDGADDAAATGAENVVETAATLAQKHGNADWADKKYANFTRECLECHNPHGTTNVKMIETTINSQTVTFTDRTQFDTAAGANDVCEVCHTQTAHNGGAGGTVV